MPNWSELLGELKSMGSPHDILRRKYLQLLFNKRGRNIITYYSGFLQKKHPETPIRDADKEMFMTAVNKIDRSKGLDLIINTEGGDIAATESIVDYLFRIFGKDITVFVPQIAMSAGTLMACMAKEIFMGLQSNLGPIDPHLNGISAKLILNEFAQAKSNLRSNNPNVEYWKIQLEKYPPTFLELCINAIKWSENLAKTWLLENMLLEEPQKETIIDDIIKQLTSPEKTYSHGRHLHIEQLEGMGLKITRLENDNDLQDIVLSIHHAYMHTFQNSRAIKIVENHNGISTILSHS